MEIIPTERVSSAPSGLQALARREVKSANLAYSPNPYMKGRGSGKGDGKVGKWKPETPGKGYG